MHMTSDYPGHIKKLTKKKLQYLEQIARFPPNRYVDHRRETGLIPGEAVVIGTLNRSVASVTGNGMEMSRITMTDRKTGQKFTAVWFGTGYPGRLHEADEGRTFLVCGKASYDAAWGWQINSPDCFTDGDFASKMILQPVYKKFTGISREAFEEFIKKSVSSPLEDPEYLKKYGIEPLNVISRRLHYPADEKDIEEGMRQNVLTDMLYFAVNMKMREADHGGKIPVMKEKNLQEKAIKSLPYTLTDDQLRVVGELTKKLEKGQHVNALIQGDVSCGKTVTAILLLILAAENGYQSVLLAPTVILAGQHFEDVRKIAEPLGIRTDFLGSGMSGKERKKVLERVRNGETDILVGTHAVTEENTVFRNPGLAVIDEEQRFGVERREMLRKKSSNDIAYVSMSATPIPRTLAMTVYGDGTDIYTIRSMPAGRKSVTTVKTDNFDPPEILLKEIREGRQAYVICPLVDADDGIPCRSCEETVRIYEEYFFKRGMPDVKVGCLNGRMKESRMSEVLNAFVRGDIAVLVATTVVEVGVNNPNASVIVIQNADRFGLSGLHQLRGRVRRGSHKPYCILMAEDTDKPRLDAMCNTEDGFELAEADLKIRKSGNLIGTEQSGKDRFMPLIIKYPAMYEYAKTAAENLIRDKNAADFVKYMSEIYGSEGKT